MYTHMYVGHTIIHAAWISLLHDRVFPQERIRSAQLETSIRKTDELLYHMMPKTIADKLRNGEPPLRHVPGV